MYICKIRSARSISRSGNSAGTNCPPPHFASAAGFFPDREGGLFKAVEAGSRVINTSMHIYLYIYTAIATATS